MLKVVKVGCRFHCANHTCQNLMGLAAEVRSYVCIYLMPSALLVASYGIIADRCVAAPLYNKLTESGRRLLGFVLVLGIRRAAFAW